MKAVAAFLLALCFLAVSHAWNCNPGPRLRYAKQIDAGMGQVVARDIHSRAYFLSGNSWYRLGRASLSHVTVGPAGIWGSYSNRVCKYVGGDFKSSPGPLYMTQVDAGGRGQVVGVRNNGWTYCLRSAQALSYYGGRTFSWNYLGRTLMYYSCGPKYGCWGVDRHYRVYVTKTVTASNCRHALRQYVSGPLMKVIEVGTDGSVFGVTRSGKVYERTGISARSKEGKGWRQVSVCNKALHVTYDLRRLWIVTTSRTILKCIP